MSAEKVKSRMPKISLPKISLTSMKFKMDRKKLLIGLVVFALLLVVLLAVVALMKNRGSVAPSPSASPTEAPQATSSGATRNESKYASDEAVLKIENDIKSASDDLTKTTVREDNLRVPSADFNISF